MRIWMEPMEMSSMIVKNKELGTGWIGLGAQAWIEFFYEKAFRKRGVQFSLTQGRRRNSPVSSSL